jgi:chromosome segregation ATPase
MANDQSFDLIAHFHPPSSELPTCPNCSCKICLSCSFHLKGDSSPTKPICELCHFYSIKSTGKVSERLQVTLEKLLSLQEQVKSELNSSKVFKIQAKSGYKDLESSKLARLQQVSLLERQVQDLQGEALIFEQKIEKYKVDLVQSTTKAKMITADRDRLNMEYEECSKRIEEFQEMIKEQEEENLKLKNEIEQMKTRGMPEDCKKLSESELKARLSKLQSKIDKVKSENQSLEQQIRLKSGTISVFSEKVSLISGSLLEPREVQNNELSIQMRNQLEQTMKLYKEINELKMKKKAVREQEMSESSCKCEII